MDIEHRNGDSFENMTLEDFVVDQTLRKRNQFGEKLCSDEQPKAVCRLLGRFVDRLMEKGLLDVEDLRAITDSRDVEGMRTIRS